MLVYRALVPLHKTQNQIYSAPQAKFLRICTSKCKILPAPQAIFLPIYTSQMQNPIGNPHIWGAKTPKKSRTPAYTFSSLIWKNTRFSLSVYDFLYNSFHDFIMQFLYTNYPKSLGKVRAGTTIYFSIADALIYNILDRPLHGRGCAKLTPNRFLEDWLFCKMFVIRRSSWGQFCDILIWTSRNTSWFYFLFFTKIIKKGVQKRVPVSARING